VSDVLEGNLVYRNLNPKCEPRLGPRGLYHAFGTHPDRQALQKAVLWVLNLSDGEHSLLDIAERSATSFELIREAADLLLQHELLADVNLESLTIPPLSLHPWSCHEHCVL
jgi:aminopeptidase-like protein